jgi:ribosome recycling factor
MPLQKLYDRTKDQMVKSLEFTSSQMSKVRTGRASASLVDGIKIDYYGSQAPLSQAATISTPDARTIVIQPFDRGQISDIEKAIQSADLGFNPQNDGNIIRIPVPPLTEERRKEYVKVCKKYAEDGKIAIRNIRREAMDDLKKLEKSKEVTEDDRKRGETEVQKYTDDYIKKIDEALAKKEKELMD